MSRPTQGKPKEKKKAPPEEPPVIDDIVVFEPGTSGETIYQRRLRAYQEKKDKRDAAVKQYADALAELRESLRLGAEVQQGKAKAKGKVVYRRRLAYKALYIEEAGEDKWEEKMEKAPLYPYYMVYVTVPKKKK